MTTEQSIHVGRRWHVLQQMKKNLKEYSKLSRGSVVRVSIKRLAFLNWIGIVEFEHEVKDES